MSSTKFSKSRSVRAFLTALVATLGLVLAITACQSPLEMGAPEVSQDGGRGLGITIYTSGYTHVYWWSAVPAGQPANGSWPGVVMGTDPVSGLKTYTFPNATSINLIFSNNGSGQTADLSRTTGSWKYASGTWTAYSPLPTATASPGTSSFSSSTLAVTLSAANPGSGTYKIDSGTAQSYTNGQVINISGTDLSVGQTRTLVLVNGSATNTYTYMKSAVPAAGITVYTSGYNNIYYWAGVPAGSPANATWPGVVMGTDSASGLKTYSFPSSTAINIIFSNNGSGQTPDLSRTTGTWLYANGAWSAYTPGAPVIPGAYPDTLGALYTPSATKFRIWSPDSSNVKVAIGGVTYDCMLVANFAGYNSIYEATVTGDQKGKTYQFSVGGVSVRDPYALMVNPGTTQGVVVDMAAILPVGGSWSPRPALTNREDSIIYEAHVRDFTIDVNSGVDASKKGKFLGMVQTGTTYGSQKTGIDHLKEMGITHIQLMPVYDFGSGMYNWGYDPANYNVPEEQYTQATTPEGRVQEFKTLVNEYHKNGIRVVMDVVYNHTIGKEIFNSITGKYYTTVDLSGCGNSINDGQAMVSRMIRDSLEQWVENYNIDGFRFDLIGVFRASEVKGWGEYLNGKYSDRNLLMYGEPWNGYATDPDDGLKVRMGKVPTLASGHVGVFNGKYREDIKGSNDGAALGYMANGATSWWGAIAAGMRGSLTAVKTTSALPNDWDSMFAADPEQSINYISAHDNYDLWDKILYSGVAGGATGYAGRMDKFSMGMVLTSQGIPFIHSGDEFLRSKVYNNDWTYAHNSYNASDNYNMVRWADKATYSSIYNYYKDAITLRKSLPGLRLTSWDEIKNRMTTKVNAGTNNAGSINVVHDGSLPAGVVVSEIDNDNNTSNGPEVVVVFNNGNNFNVTLPAGTWTKIFDIAGQVSKSDKVSEGTSVTVFKKN